MPPAFSETSRSGGPEPSWNRSTIESRPVRDTPPCRNGASNENCSADVAHEQVAHLPELGEHERPFTLVEQLGDQLVEARELARPTGQA